MSAEAQIGGDLSLVTQRAGICSHANHLVMLSFGWSVENKHFYLSPLNFALYMMELDTGTSSFEARVQQRESQGTCAGGLLGNKGGTVSGALMSD